MHILVGVKGISNSFAYHSLFIGIQVHMHRELYEAVCGSGAGSCVKSDKFPQVTSHESVCAFFENKNVKPGSVRLVVGSFLCSKKKA